MIHCVPDCDASREDINADISSIFSVPPETVNWDVQHLRKAKIFDLAYGSDCRLSDTDWTSGVEYLSMQPQPQPQNAKYGKHLSGQISQEREQANIPTTSKIFKDGSLDALFNNVMAVDDQACTNHTADALTYSYSSIDDDMLAYLYPFDIPLDRDDCCDTFAELANHHLHARKQLAVEQSLEPLSLNKAADVVALPDAAQDLSFQPRLGSGKAPAAQHPLICKNPQNVQPTIKSAAVHQCPPDVLSNSISSSTATSSAMLPPKCQSIRSPANSSLPAVEMSAMNFPYFSRPAALAKASLHTLSMCNSNHRHQQFSKSNVETCVSFGESTTGVKSPIVCSEEAAQSLICPNALSISSIQKKNCGHSSLPSSQNTGYVDSDTVTNRTRDAGSGNQGLKQGMSSLTCSTVHEDKISSPSAPEIMQAVEPSSATSSGDSGNISKKREKIAIKDGKRKTRENENRTDLKSDVDADNDYHELKRPVRGRNSKRSRAAEVHNLSERRRRDRINEKMRALQELIPNSNKTDKASMLDEAIEYLKMLQSQIQIMSMGSGMTVPPLIVPAGLQQLRVPQMAHVPNVSMGVGLGMGMGMRMGLGMMGMTNNGSGWHVNPSPLSGSPHNSMMPSASFSDSREPYLSTGILDCHNAMVNPQQLQQQQTQSQHLHCQIQQYPNGSQ
ncbi:hypothetical protein O6H91_01G121800 [Diphasiastrum complanatum]|uniref:Uncharacterized protein n=2 Tax=Diphasiastrum complanatum TaxID=34168 RepID=A0ACC2EVJ3_DIPCM|nr:hypothetical protein O6H91_01G121800 [Diphasiastrum complanatum]